MRERREASRGSAGTGFVGTGGSAVDGPTETVRAGGSITLKVTSIGFDPEKRAAPGTAFRMDSTTR